MKLVFSAAAWARTPVSRVMHSAKLTQNTQVTWTLAVALLERDRSGPLRKQSFFSAFRLQGRFRLHSPPSHEPGPR